MKSIPQIILGSLIYNETFTRKVIPYLKPEYFDNEERKIFTAVTNHMQKYNTLPTKESILISIDNEKNLNETEFKLVTETLDTVTSNQEDHDVQWLVDTTEKHVKDKAIYNAIMQSIKILDEEKDKTIGVSSRGGIPDILSEALAVNFDERIGHDYIENSNDRFDFYHRTERCLSFDLDSFNKITKNGFRPKTLNVFLAPTHAGKTLVKCHFTSSYLAQGLNVLYITLEMAEEAIAERIDANLFNMDMTQVEQLNNTDYSKRIAGLKSKIKGKLFVKQYPPASVSVNNFRHLLQELKLKKKFKPDVICVDYLNLCMSSRLKMGNTVNSYSYIKSVVEELRGLAVEHDVAIITSTQTNREGYDNTDIDLTATSESMSIAHTADFMAAIIRTDELDQMNQIMFKQLKNRYDDLGKMKKFIVGVDRNKMKLYDVNASASTMINSSTQQTHTTASPQNRFNKFNGIKV